MVDTSSRSRECITQREMGIFFIIILLVVFAATIVEMVHKHQNRKGWINGVEYDRSVYGLRWMTARATSDPTNFEFDVEFNPHDGHFYDRDGTGYHATEIYIKKIER